MDSNARSPRLDDADYEEAIDVTPYVRMLWRHRMAIASATLVATVLTFVVSHFLPPTYEATAALIVNPAKLVEAGAVPPDVTTATFRALLNNQTIASEVVKQIGLDKPPYSLSASRFLANRVTIGAIRDATVIEVAVRLGDASLAAAAANAYADRGVALVGKVSDDQTTVLRTLLKADSEQARERLNEAEKTLLTAKQKSQVELVKGDVDSLLRQRGELARLIVEIEGEKARLTTATEELSKQQRVRGVPSAAHSGSILNELAKRERDPAPPGDSIPPPPGDSIPPPMELRGEALNPFVNPVYEILDEQVALTRTHLAALQRQRAAIAGTLKLGASELSQLADLYKRQIDITRLETEFQLAKTVYLEITTRYEQARAQSVSRTTTMQVLDHALPPDRPVAPRPVRYAAIAFALALIVSSLWATLFGTKPTRRRSEPMSV